MNLTFQHQFYLPILLSRTRHMWRFLIRLTTTALCIALIFRAKVWVSAYLILQQIYLARVFQGLHFKCVVDDLIHEQVQHINPKGLSLFCWCITYYQCFDSGSGWILIQSLGSLDNEPGRQKWSTKSRKCQFHVLKSWMFYLKATGFSWSLDSKWKSFTCPKRIFHKNLISFQ